MFFFFFFVGELYDALDAQLSEERLKARLLIKELKRFRKTRQPNAVACLERTYSQCRGRTLAATAILLRCMVTI